MTEKSNEVVLKVAGISKRFGGLQALSDVGITIQRGQVYGLIGPNGAGKTTFFNVITGLYTPDAGTFELAGKPYEPTAVHEVAKAGIARTFQNIRLFKEMSVLENLLVAQHMWVNRNMLAGILNTKGYRKAESDALDCAFYWLEVVDLVDCANRLAGELSYGQQRRLEIARAMCTRPQIICLDEPAAGLNPKETEDLKALISVLREEHNVTVLLIEHDMKLVMSISDHIVVINQGTPLANGTPEQIRDNPEVIKAYLGEA